MDDQEQEVSEEERMRRLDVIAQKIDLTDDETDLPGV